MVWLLVLCGHLELRGIWVPRWSLGDGTRIFAEIDGRFNHIFLQIYANGEAYYPSAHAPSRKPDDRWLKEFIADAHRRAIAVSAWINVCYAWGHAPVSTAGDHPVVKNRDWFVADISGESMLGLTVDDLKRMNLEGYYLAPANRQVRDHLKKIMVEIASRYDFDGIHLDYIRYPNARFIYDRALRAGFERKYYVDPQVPDSRRYGLGGDADIGALYDSHVKADLTGFIREARAALDATGRRLMLSAAVKPDYQRARDEFYQDWLTWLNSGDLDFVCLMAYTNRIEPFLEKLRDVLQDPRRVAFGLGLYALSPEKIRDQVGKVAASDYGGVVFFSYEALKKNSNYRRVF